MDFMFHVLRSACFTKRWVEQLFFSFVVVRFTRMRKLSQIASHSETTRFEFNKIFYFHLILLPLFHFNHIFLMFYRQQDIITIPQVCWHASPFFETFVQNDDIRLSWNRFRRLEDESLTEFRSIRSDWINLCGCLSTRQSNQDTCNIFEIHQHFLQKQTVSMNRKKVDRVPRNEN